MSIMWLAEDAGHVVVRDVEYSTARLVRLGRVQLQQKPGEYEARCGIIRLTVCSGAT